MKNKEEVKEYLLNNIEVLKDIVKELNGYSGELEQLDYYNNDEEFFNIFYNNNVVEAVRACCYGDYNFMDDYVIINAYGNLTSCNEWQLQDELRSYIDEIMDVLEEYKNNIYIYDEKLEKLIKES